MSRLLLTAALAALLMPTTLLADDAGGDARRIQWIRPFDKAIRAAGTANRLMLVKPIYGGTNTPVEEGKLAGGKNDCEGSW